MILLKIHLLTLYVCVCGDRRTACGSWLVPSTIWILETELRKLDLVINAFTH